MDEIKISGLYRFLIKGCAGESVEEVGLDRYGMTGDRRGMIVDKDGKFLTQREFPKMALIKPHMESDYLHLKAGSMGSLLSPINLDNSKRIKVRVWKDEVEAIDQGELQAEYLSLFLGIACRLVWMPLDFTRTIDQRFASDEQTSFADGFPLLIIGDKSLEDLNNKLEIPVAMERFRPNITISGSTAFAEDTWKDIRIGSVRIKLSKFCARCVVTTVDQQEGIVTGKEPLTTLVRYRTMAEPTTGKKGAMFGQNAIHYLSEGEENILRVGDKVEILSYRL